MTDPAPASTPLPWRALVAWSLAGTVVLGTLALVSASNEGGILDLIRPGIDGPATPVIVEDFDDPDLREGLGHDGQQFYVLARELTDLDDAAPYLGRPRYRARRIGLPLLARVAYPPGKGEGLVISLFGVNLAGIFAGSMAMGALATRRGAPPWTAAAFAALPASLICLRITLADGLALGLALAALAALDRDKLAWAVPLAVLAVLSRETVVLLPIAYALYRRTPRSALPAAASVAAFVAWDLALRRILPEGGNIRGLEFDFVPFRGLVRALTGVERELYADWSKGLALTLAVTVVGIAVVAIRSNSLLWRVSAAVLLAYQSILGLPFIYKLTNAARSTSALLAIGFLALVTHPRVVTSFTAARTPGAPPETEVPVADAGGSDAAHP
jgi:hypothetical protein